MSSPYDEDLSEEQIMNLLRSHRAIIDDDHFVYVSGHHGNGWIAKDVLFPHTRDVARLAAQLARRALPYKPQWVCGPCTGGMTLAYWVAHALDVPAYFTEHGAPAPGELRGKFYLGRGFDEGVRGKRGLVVDDVINTGHSIMQTIEVLRAAGAEVAVAGALVTRGNFRDYGVPFISLAEVHLTSWDEADCHLCRDNAPINTRYAHGADYLAQKAEK